MSFLPIYALQKVFEDLEIKVQCVIQYHDTITYVKYSYVTKNVNTIFKYNEEIVNVLPRVGGAYLSSCIQAHNISL